MSSARVIVHTEMGEISGVRERGTIQKQIDKGVGTFGSGSKIKV